MSTTQQVTASRLVAIVGGTGAGKGWMANRLCKLLGEQACHLSLDNFYRDRSHLAPAKRAHVNFDVPRAIDWARAGQVLDDCLAGQPTRVPNYDFTTHTRLADMPKWQPKPVIFVEGLWLLWHPPVRRLFALKIYLDCPAPLRLSRRKARDIAERGRTADTVERAFKKIAPLHERYVEPQKKWADIVLPQPFSEAAITLLSESLWAVLQASPLTSWRPETLRTDLLTSLKANEYTD